MSEVVLEHKFKSTSGGSNCIVQMFNQPSRHPKAAVFSPLKTPSYKEFTIISVSSTSQDKTNRTAPFIWGYLIDLMRY